MPRLARIDRPGLLQHVMGRGIEGRKIFLDKKDYNHFLDCLEIVLGEAKDTRCYAWALIPNHFHLLLLIGRNLSLSTIMMRLLTRYASYFNGRHRRRGHLFQNRYKSIVCDRDNYLLELTRYIHLNPVKGKILKSIDELDGYEYTGHSVILGKIKREWQESDELLRYYGERRGEARRIYKKFVKEGLGKNNRNLEGGGLIRSAGGREEIVKRGKEETLYIKVVRASH